MKNYLKNNHNHTVKHTLNLHGDFHASGLCYAGTRFLVAYLWKALAGDRSLLLANFCCRVMSVPWHDYFVHVFSAFPDPFRLLILPSSGFNVFAYKKKERIKSSWGS